MSSQTSIPFQLTTFSPDRFQVMELLGQGGMGQVFKARDRHLNRNVALKFILARETESLLVRLVLEAQYQASLDHPHILKVYGVGIWEGRTCVAMQLVDGTSLGQIATTLSLPKRVELMVQAARGMHSAHLHGLIHRDVKPQNILVETRGNGDLHAFVMDFGLARATEAETLTLSGAILGSPHYMSPEQAAGGRLVDARSDIYSLGATLYAVVVGTPPFSHGPALPASLEPTRIGAPASDWPEWLQNRSLPPPAPSTDVHALTILRRVVDDLPVPPRQFNAGISKDLETIILRCLEKDPALRYPSAASLADDLERYLAGNPISARRASWPRRARAWARRNPRMSSVLAGALGVGLLALLVSGVALQRTRLKAQIAARFEQAAKETEIRFSMGALSPQQNRPSEVARLLSQMEEKKAEALSIGPMAAAPGAFFQGRACLILGRNREALIELQRAWDLGFRSPMAARSLGSALLESHSEEAQRLTSGGPQREADQQALAQKYLRPAVKYFQMGAEGGELKNLHLAQVAFIEGRDEAALELASAELKTTPWTGEAYRLRHLVWARRADSARDLASFEAHSKEAEAQLQLLTEVARGDARSHLASARWWIRKAELLASRFRVFQPHLIHRGLDQAEDASKLDPTSPAPYALRAIGWGHLSNIQGMEGQPSLDPKKITEAVLLEADRALRLDPNCLSALASKGFAKLFTAHEGLGSAEQDLDEALRLAGRMLQLDDRAAAALHLKSLIHRYRARQDALKGGDGRAHWTAWAESSRALYQLWPEVLEFGISACSAMQRLAFSAARAGDAKLARSHMQEARRILDKDLSASPLPPNIRLLQISLTRMEGNLEGLLGQSPLPAYGRAAEALSSSPLELQQTPDFIDEQFTLTYERALVDLDQGKDLSAQIAVLQSLLDGWVKAKRSPMWHAANQLFLMRLRGLNQLRREGASFWSADGLKRLRSSESGSAAGVMETWWGVEGALRVQSAIQSRHALRKSGMGRGLHQLNIAGALDDSLRWTFRHEFKMAAEP